MAPYYQDEYVTLYCGDCREIVPTLGQFDLLLTDPPYGVDFKGKATKFHKGNGGYISNDSDIGISVVKQCIDVCDRGIVFTGNRLLHDYPKPRDIGCVYCPCGAGTGPWGFICFHAILFYGKRPGGATSPSSFISHSVSPSNGHPCPKPMNWMTWAVTIGSRSPHETILDPFAGSGTTGVAAKLLNRKCTLIEKEEKYCEIAARRLSQGVLPLWEKEEN